MADCSNCGLQVGDDSLICFRCGQRRPVSDSSEPPRESAPSLEKPLESPLEVVQPAPHDPITSFIKRAGIGVAGLVGLTIFVVVVIGPTEDWNTTVFLRLPGAAESVSPEVHKIVHQGREAVSTLADEKETLQLVEAAASAGPEVDGDAYRDRGAASIPVVVKANRDYSFDEFKAAFALEVRYYAVVNDSRDYELKWLYFTGEVVETKDTTTQELMGDLATKYKFPNTTTHWASIRVEPQRDILVSWADDSEFQEDLRVGESIELMAFHKFVRDGVPRMALDYGKVRFLDR